MTKENALFLERKTHIVPPAELNVFNGILHDETGERKTEDSGNMSQRAVDLCLGGAPFMVGEARIALGILRFGAHTAVGAAGGVLTLVGKEFIGVNAGKFLARKNLCALKLATKRACQRIALHLPELRRPDASGIELKRGSHGGEKLRFRLAGQQYKGSLVLERVDSVDIVVVCV